MMRVEEAAVVPTELRRAYLRALVEPQELFLERLVQAGRTLLLRDADAVIGYAMVHDAVLVELYLVDAHVGRGAEALALLWAGHADRALCKTFDGRMLAAIASRPARLRPVGLLFRGVRDAEFEPDPRLEVRAATRADLPEILAMHDGFFDDAAEIEHYLAEDGLVLHRGPDGALVGCGVARRVIPDADDVDVGMVVAIEHRRRGLGEHIVRHLKRRCLAAGLRPICGCDVDNVASRRALERAGFVTAHAIVELTY
jgi:RimJ/RimL family protein N-acetyltransferase